MRRNDFNKLIDRGDFRELFIAEMGWNNPSNLSPVQINVDSVDYEFNPVADKSGFQVYTCHVEEIPSASDCKKIDNKLRKYSFDYISIFVQRDTSHHLWLTPVKNNEKRELVKTEYIGGGAADFLFSKIDGLTFSLTERVFITDVKARVQGSFRLNSEDVTKKFYTQFKKEHKAFSAQIIGITSEQDRDWYTSVMLNRLMFCYFIQKKGFLDLNTNYLQQKLRWVKERQGEDHFFGSFYKGFLCALFHDGLNSPRHADDFISKYGRIPYLNGGMFDEHQLEKVNSDIDIADCAFENLFNFFDKWNWHLDTRLTSTGKDINPDVLGYIFEQYINDRAQMGAYYTKEDITEYIGKNCIIPFLMDKTREKSNGAFRPNGMVWTHLKQSGDRYVYDAVKKGYTPDWQDRIPDYIQQGIDTTQPELLERRKRWNEKTHDDFALPTEIWRETVERLQRCETLIGKIASGDIHEINDFITYNLDIRQFAEDVVRKTDDHLFVLHFYHALQGVTILDPTCGSGAFLFAALNILEPLYEACLERMEEFNAENRNLFKDELEELATRYNSNRQYFIYKSIILRNLYGVDIMVEATEIAKLRLFLKMVAVVDVDKRKDNLGLDPLPDIDFNIKCGNTLVGYATERELDNALAYGDMFANQEFKEKISTEMQNVAKAYSLFRSAQLKTFDDNASIKETKKMLKTRLAELNNLLNRYMHKAITAGSDYESWLKSHQPFHWLAEFYQIIKENGGFDVIIGNPPYVSINKIHYIKKTKEFSCSDLYGFVIKRVLQIKSKYSYHGFIVMHNMAFSRNFVDVRTHMRKQKGSKWFSFFSRIPSGLFSGDVRVRNCIYILSPNGCSDYTSKLNRWFTEQRPYLFGVQKYEEFIWNDVIPMLHSSKMQDIYEPKEGLPIDYIKEKTGKSLVFKGVAYNSLSVSDVIPPARNIKNVPFEQTEINTIGIKAEYYPYFLLLCMGKFYLSKWLTYGDDFHLTSKDIMNFKFPFDKLIDSDKKALNIVFDKVVKELASSVQYKLNAGKYVGTFNTKKLWYLTDLSDRIFYKYMKLDPIHIENMVESHIAACVLTDKGQINEE